MVLICMAWVLQLRVATGITKCSFGFFFHIGYSGEATRLQRLNEFNTKIVSLKEPGEDYDNTHVVDMQNKSNSNGLCSYVLHEGQRDREREKENCSMA